MDCLMCVNKNCKAEAKDCNGKRDEVLDIYKDEYIKSNYVNADKLVANGRAGELSRLHEIVEFAQLNHYKNIAIAYCFCMENLAREVRDYLHSEGFNISSVRCTINGIRENQIEGSMAEGVNCNPIGQAEEINNSDAEFVIDMGLCLGHDVLYHQHLKKPGTTLIVKDRVYNHNPARALTSYRDYNEDFLVEHMDNRYGMRSCSWLKEQIANNTGITILDLREEEKFKESYIPGSINIPLRKLPRRFRDELPDKKKQIICVCGGSIMSSYANMFLYSRGYKNVYSLSGGFSGWEKS